MTRPDFLTPLAWDFLWEAAGAGELPYPLEVPSHGETVDERARLRSQVFAELRSQGMVDGRGRADPRLEDWLGLIGRAEHSIDSVFIAHTDGPSVRALAVGNGGTALMATQDPQGLWLRPLPPGSLVSSVVEQLPPARRGTEPSLTLPVDEVAAGGNRPDQKALASLFEQPRLRAGQLAANSRNRLGGRKRSIPLSWFDTDSGRYLTYTKKGRDGRDWATIAPADPPTLRKTLTDLLTSVTP